MSDGTDTAVETAPASMPASDVAATETPTTEPTDPSLADGEPQPLETSTVDDFDEIDFDGEKYKVPKKLKDGFLMQADYTKKTQGIAEERKALQTEREAVVQNAEAAQAHVRDIGKVLAMNDQLAEYDKVDWRTLTQSDPFKAQEMFQARTLLRDQRDGLIAQIQQNEHKRSQDAQQSFARRYAETDEALADPVKGIKGWNQELGGKLRSFALANGVSDAQIRDFSVNAPLVKLLHKAFLADQLINTKRTEAKTAATPKVEAQPLITVTGKGAKPAVNLAEAGMDAYVTERKKQGYGKPKH